MPNISPVQKRKANKNDKLLSHRFHSTGQLQVSAYDNEAQSYTTTTKKKHKWPTKLKKFFNRSGNNLQEIA